MNDQLKSVRMSDNRKINNPASVLELKFHDDSWFCIEIYDSSDKKKLASDFLDLALLINPELSTELIALGEEK